MLRFFNILNFLRLAYRYPNCGFPHCPCVSGSSIRMLSALPPPPLPPPNEELEDGEVL